MKPFATEILNFLAYVKNFFSRLLVDMSHVTRSSPTYVGILSRLSGLAVTDTDRITKMNIAPKLKNSILCDCLSSSSFSTPGHDTFSFGGRKRSHTSGLEQYAERVCIMLLDGLNIAGGTVSGVRIDGER